MEITVTLEDGTEVVFDPCAENSNIVQPPFACCDKATLKDIIEYARLISKMGFVIFNGDCQYTFYSPEFIAMVDFPCMV